MSHPLEYCICIVGDIHNAFLNKHEENKIQRGLIEAAVVTDAQVLCSSDEASMKFISTATMCYSKATQIKVKNFDMMTTSRKKNKINSCISLEQILLGNKGNLTTCLVVGGNRKFLTSLTRFARNVDGVRFIAVRGSGGAADFLATILTSDWDSSHALELDTSLNFDDVDKDEMNELLVQLKLLENKMTLWSANEQTELGVVVEQDFFALSQGIGVNVSDQLRTLLAWHRHDLAERVVSKMSNLLQIKKTDLKEFLKDGLINNEVGFVRKLIRMYEGFEESLTSKELYSIYRQSVSAKKQDNAAKLFMNVYFPSQVSWPDSEHAFFFGIGNFVEKLLNDVYLNPYSSIYDNDKKSECDTKDIFCWAILLNRCEMAALFWTRGQNYTCAALFASAMLEKLSSLAKSFGKSDLSFSMENNARCFEWFASSIVNKLQITRSDICQKLLVSGVNEYGNTTPLYISGTNMLMDFMEQDACQTKLTNIWNGNMAWNTPMVKKCFGIFLPFVLLPTIEFKSSTKDRETKTQPTEKDITPRYYTLCSCRRDQKRIGLIDAIHSFYTAPAVKFNAYVTFYVIYLVTFSITLITDLHALDDGGMSGLEVLVIVWTLGFMLEEVRQVCEADQPSFLNKIKYWAFTDMNTFDLITFMLLIISIVLRCSLYGDSFKWARYLYSITLLLLWWKTMRFFYVNDNIGPKIVMVGEMLKDLFFLFAVFFIVVISVGVAYTINIYPNIPFDWMAVKKVSFHPYWQIFGELALDYIRGREPDSECTTDPVLLRNGKLPACPVTFDMITMIAAVYLVLMNIILVNVLIAMFSYTFQKVQDKAGKVARFHNYFLVREYYNLSTLMAPLNIISIVYRLIKRCCCEPNTEFKVVVTEKEKMEMTQLETEALQSSVLTSLIRHDFRISKFSEESRIKKKIT